MPCSELVLLLADGRFPGGGYAHSGGLEAAVAEGAVGDQASLHAYCAGRLASSGLVDAWLAAAACRGEDPLGLQAQCEARIASPALRAAGRSLGRGLRRSAKALWPTVGGCLAEQHPVVLGVVAAAAGLDSPEAAMLAAHGQLMAVASAAPKLFAIDMIDALVVVSALAEAVQILVAEVATLSECPNLAAPLVELRAERHATWEVRLFAS